MGISVVVSGTQTAVIGTEHVLHSAVANGKTFILTVNTSAMVNGDVLVLRGKQGVLSGVSVFIHQTGTYQHVQEENCKTSIPQTVPSNCHIAYTLLQVSGTGRDFDYSVISLS